MTEREHRTRFPLDHEPKESGGGRACPQKSKRAPACTPRPNRAQNENSGHHHYTSLDRQAKALYRRSRTLTGRDANRCETATAPVQRLVSGLKVGDNFRLGDEPRVPRLGPIAATVRDGRKVPPNCDDCLPGFPLSGKGDDMAGMWAGDFERLVISSLEKVRPLASQPQQSARKLELDLAGWPGVGELCSRFRAFKSSQRLEK